MPGYDVKILDNDGNELSNGELGAVAIKLPLPPGSLPTLWNAEERFKNLTSLHFQGSTKPEMPG